MVYFLNSYSIHGQFESDEKCFLALKRLTKVREYLKTVNSDLYIDLDLKKKPFFTNGKTLSSIKDRTKRQYLLSWFDKAGPYWITDRQSDELNYWVDARDDSVILTDSSLHEALETCSPIISITPSNFCISPFVGIKKTDSDDFSQEILNFWNENDAIDNIDSYYDFSDWNDVFARLRKRLDNCIIEDLVLDQIKKLNFDKHIVVSIISICSSIDCYYSINDDEKQTYWENLLGRNIISDSSQTEKTDPIFKKRMMFKLSSGESVRCFWHGKFTYDKNPYRIHFCFPSDVKDSKCHIAYIGPKLTKK